MFVLSGAWCVCVMRQSGRVMSWFMKNTMEPDKGCTQTHNWCTVVVKMSVLDVGWERWDTICCLYFIAHGYRNAIQSRRSHTVTLSNVGRDSCFWISHGACHSYCQMFLSLDFFLLLFLFCLDTTVAALAGIFFLPYLLFSNGIFYFSLSLICVNNVYCVSYFWPWSQWRPNITSAVLNTHSLNVESIPMTVKVHLFIVFFFDTFSQYGRSDSYRVATTQDKDEKESPKKKGGKDLDDLKKEVPIVSTLLWWALICSYVLHWSLSSSESS